MLTAVPAYQHGIEQARYYTAQYHYAYAESQRKVSLAPNTCFGGCYAARETEVDQRIPDPTANPTQRAVKNGKRWLSMKMCHL